MCCENWQNSKTMNKAHYCQGVDVDVVVVGVDYYIFIFIL